jgi:type IV pilus assembly protein PilB
MPDTFILKNILNLISPDFAQQHNLVPMGFDNNSIKVACMKKPDPEIVNDLEFLTGYKIVAVIVREDELRSLHEKLYGTKAQSAHSARSDVGEFEVLEKVGRAGKDSEIVEGVDEISTVSFVNKIITNAVDSRVSDIHVEAYEGQFRIRYRRDGVLQEVHSPSIEKRQAIISRIKIMADLDIAEKRRPQDGRIRVKRNSHVIDIRVSTLPTDFGEKVVMRILDKSQLNLDLSKLGFENRELELFKKAIELPYGMVLVTGPTGSGKTTTLYAALNYLNSPDVNILTIEDPIEYNLNGVNQSQVKSDIGFTFARALRSFLRQDPDVIMVGEIRDQETAEIAIRAALTGHLVLSTLHTNSAADTLTRLLDMGQEPFLIASSVKLVIAQRLLRTLCENCKKKGKPSDKLERFPPSARKSLAKTVFFNAVGCPECNGTGYLGRTAVFEIMPITPDISDAVNRRASARELKEIACKEGMHTLQDTALVKLRQGITTIDEVLRETDF